MNMSQKRSFVSPPKTQTSIVAFLPCMHSSKKTFLKTSSSSFKFVSKQDMQDAVSANLDTESDSKIFIFLG